MHPPLHTICCLQSLLINPPCSINGVPACANEKLLTDILRKEWGFKGLLLYYYYVALNFHLGYESTCNNFYSIALESYLVGMTVH